MENGGRFSRIVHTLQRFGTLKSHRAVFLPVPMAGDVTVLMVQACAMWVSLAFGLAMVARSGVKSATDKAATRTPEIVADRK